MVPARPANHTLKLPVPGAGTTPRLRVPSGAELVVGAGVVGAGVVRGDPSSSDKKPPVIELMEPVMANATHRL